ncbi:MAG: methyltransferase domain-containing protein [Cyanobacteria bacterium P01_D01_bin.105]
MSSRSSLRSTARFSDRVENYVRYRPSYPTQVLSILEQETGLEVDSAIADIGSGTGISAELFLKNGNTVFGIEPNQPMRQAAEQQLARYTHSHKATFHSINGTAEATTLPNHCVDYIVCAQAFHWFNQAQAKQEFTRILRANGWLVLMWNTRRIESTPFLKDYEALLLRYGTDYQQIRHRNITTDELKLFFNSDIQIRTFDNQQHFDFEQLKGRLLSSSYTPKLGHPNFEPMLNELQKIFEQHQTNHKIHFEYDTELYFGRAS